MILRQIDIKTYSEHAEPFLGVFASEQWLNIYSGTIICVGIFKDEKQLDGGFFYLREKKFGQSFVKLPPYTPHCGLFYKSSATNRSSANSSAKEIITLVSDYFRELASAVTVLAFPSGIVDLQPFIWNNFKVIPNYTYQIDLTKTIGEITGNFDSKNRNIIAKAQKENIELKVSSLSKEKLYEFFRLSLETTGANIYERELKRVFNVFARVDNSFSYEAYHEGKLTGVVFCVFDKRACYYLLGGVDKSSGINGVNNLLVLKCIELAKEKGCIIFDFEGSMLKGVEKFFRSFGGNLVPYFTANKGRLPFEILLKFKKPHIF